MLKYSLFLFSRNTAMLHCALCFQNRGDFYQTAYVALLSCLARATTTLHVHLVTEDSFPHRHPFEALCAQWGHSLTWHSPPPLPGELLDLFRPGALHGYTEGSLYRLQLHEIIPADKLVYVDCDIVFERDVADLYTLDMGDAWLLAAHDPERRWSRGKKRAYLQRLGIAECRYFNSGVLLMNLKALREASAHGNVFWRYYRDLAARHPDLPYPLYDQDMLNAIFSTDRQRLRLVDASFNYELCLFQRRFLPPEALEGRILHFAALKPWEKFFPAHLAYWRWFALSPWGGTCLDRIASRFFDPGDARMRMLMDVWRRPGPFRWLWKALRHTPLLRSS